MVELIKTVVIGAGQAGLSSSYLLMQQGSEHVVLDKGSRPGNSWSAERWDSFTFVTPNWTFRLPGSEYDGPEMEGFMPRGDLIERFDRYAEENKLPITYNTRVTSVQFLDGKWYRIRTEGGKEYHARNVVVANGWFQVGKIPPFAARIPPAVQQLHTSQYRNPQSLPSGAVLVVGSGQSGTQIAEELYQSGRKVFLATGGAPHAPRHYRGKDIFGWIFESGFADRTFEEMRSIGRPFVPPTISGKDGGHALNLHKFYRDGVILLGHARDYVDGRLLFAPDLIENLGKADAGQKFILNYVDRYIQRTNVAAPAEEIPVLEDGYQAPEFTSLDLHAEGINTIIWACGYTYDASIFEFPK